MDMTRPVDTHEGSWTSPDDDSDPAGCGRSLDGRMMRDRIPFNNTLSVKMRKTGNAVNRWNQFRSGASLLSGNLFLFVLPLFFKFFGNRLRHLAVGGKLHGKLGLTLGQ